MTEVPINTLRNRILKKRGLVPPKPKKVKLPIEHEPEDLTIVENIPLLPKMKYIESKYSVKVKTDVFIGSLNDVARRYKWEVDRSTISRWRKYLKLYLMEVVK